MLKIKAVVNSISAQGDKKLEMDTMINSIIQARSKESEGEIEVRAFYGMNTMERNKMKMLSSLAVDGERTRM